MRAVTIDERPSRDPALVLLRINLEFLDGEFDRCVGIATQGSKSLLLCLHGEN